MMVFMLSDTGFVKFRLAVKKAKNLIKEIESLGAKISITITWRTERSEGTETKITWTDGMAKIETKWKEYETGLDVEFEKVLKDRAKKAFKNEDA